MRLCQTTSQSVSRLLLLLQLAFRFDHRRAIVPCDECAAPSALSYLARVEIACLKLVSCADLLDPFSSPHTRRTTSPGHSSVRWRAASIGAKRISCVALLSVYSSKKRRLLPWICLCVCACVHVSVFRCIDTLSMSYVRWCAIGWLHSLTRSSSIGR